MVRVPNRASPRHTTFGAADAGAQRTATRPRPEPADPRRRRHRNPVERDDAGLGRSIETREFDLGLIATGARLDIKHYRASRTVLPGTCGVGDRKMQYSPGM